MTTAEPGAPARDFRADVQALRAVAVVLVVLDHLVGRPSGGFIGVDVFFVISGYLISGLLLKELARTGKVSLRDFYVRRVRRILPMALLVLVTTVLASFAVLLRSRAHSALVDALWAGGFLANVHFAAVGTDYFSQGSPPSPLQHYWSLSVEEQFYAVWPLALLLLGLVLRRRAGSRRLPVAAVALVVCAASLAYSVHLTSVAQTDAYFSTLTRAWELGLGAVVAALQPSLLRLPALLRTSAAWLGLGGIALGTVLIRDETPFPGTAAVLPVVATAVVLGAGHPAWGPGRSWLLANPLVQYVGNVSYSLYLWHWPCIVLAAAYFGSGTPKFYVAGSALPAALSVLTYHMVEDPVRRSLWLSRKPAGYRPTGLRGWYAQSRRGLDVALVSLAVVSFFLAGFLSPSRSSDRADHTGTTAASAERALTPDQRRISDALAVGRWTSLSPSLDDLPRSLAPQWKPDGCLNVWAVNRERCVYGSGSKLAVVLGDSIAVSWAPAVIAALPGWRVQVLTLGECPFPALPTARNQASRSVVYAACQEHRVWTRGVVAQLRPDLVFASSQASFVSKVVGHPASDVAANLRLWQTATTQTLRDVSAPGRRVVLVTSPPPTGDLQSCLSRQGSPADCVRPLQPSWLGAAAAERSAAAAAGAAYVDPRDWFCFEGRCPAVVGSTPVMWDGQHLTAAYARSLAGRLAPALRGAAVTG